MANHGKSYPDRSRDPRRQVSRTYLTPEQNREMELSAFDEMMREAPGTGPVSQLGDYMLDRYNK